MDAVEDDDLVGGEELHVHGGDADARVEEVPFPSVAGGSGRGDKDEEEEEDEGGCRVGSRHCDLTVNYRVLIQMLEWATFCKIIFFCVMLLAMEEGGWRMFGHGLVAFIS